MMNYREYLQSQQWYVTRDRRLYRAGFRCEFELDGKRCTVTRSLNVHHRCYDRLGAELDGDLEVLCRLHHLVRHMMEAECEVCGAQLIDDEHAALSKIEQQSENGRLPSLIELGLKKRNYDDMLLCWFCSDKLG